MSGALDPALRPRWSGRLVVRRVRSLWRRWFLWLLLALLVLAVAGKIALDLLLTPSDPYSVAYDGAQK